MAGDQLVHGAAASFLSGGLVALGVASCTTPILRHPYRWWSGATPALPPEVPNVEALRLLAISPVSGLEVASPAPGKP